MSVAAICEAVRDQLRKTVGLQQEECDLSLDGKPYPLAGQRWVSVHPGQWRGISDDYNLHEEVSVNVTVTYRIGDTPLDRTANNVWVNYLEPLTRQIITAIHFNEVQVRIAANTLLGDEGANDGPDGFYLHLVLKDGGKPEYKEDSWFSSVPGVQQEYTSKGMTHGNMIAQAGVAQTLVFGGAMRAQQIAFME